MRLKVDEYIENYYNNRYQWNLLNMTPAQYRSHLLTA
ncbi:IS3 family transposase [Peribacillus loiseleuriae]